VELPAIVIASVSSVVDWFRESTLAPACVELSASRALASGQVAQDYRRVRSDRLSISENRQYRQYDDDKHDVSSCPADV
jgi:hypothetical protein